MQNIKTLLALLVFSIGLKTKGQTLLRTIAPTEKIILGESFQVQFLIGADGSEFTYNTPSFNGFRLVAGPNIYSGSLTENGTLKHFQNLVFTLTPLRQGRLSIKGMTFLYKGKQVIAPEVFVQVITKKEADDREGYDSEYFLRPGEDPYDKIRKNIFLRVAVNKKNCIVGEPVTATFKLYSRLQSRSDIARNPGFYGFSVYDAVNVMDKVRETETVNGRVFDVYTVRQVHLYPQQAGTFNIESMELSNEVEFSRTVVNRKTEQEITENMYGPKENRIPAEGAEVYKTILRSDPVTITVEPLPSTNIPEEFSGAVGNFNVKTYLSKDVIDKNGQSSLLVEITGKGNFTQIPAPKISWPYSVEGFEAVTTETLDKKIAPAIGKKTFKYSFVALKPGDYTLPSLKFSYYDPVRKQYKTISTGSLKLKINEGASTSEELSSKSGTPGSFTWLGILGLTTIGLIVGFLLFWRRKKNKIQNTILPGIPSIRNVTKILEPSLDHIDTNPIDFYKELNKGIWNYFNDRLADSGSIMSKNELKQRLIERGIKNNLISEVISLLEQFEIATYTGVMPEESHAQSYHKVMSTLEQIENAL